MKPAISATGYPEGITAGAADRRIREYLLDTYPQYNVISVRMTSWPTFVVEIANGRGEFRVSYDVVVRQPRRAQITEGRSVFDDDLSNLKDEDGIAYRTLAYLDWTPVEAGAADLAQAVLDIVRAEKELEEAKANIPNYTGDSREETYYTMEQEIFNRARNRFQELIRGEIRHELRQMMR